MSSKRGSPALVPCDVLANVRREVMSEAPDQEPPEEEVTPSEQPKGRPSFARLRRSLTEDELSSSGISKILLEDLHRVEGEKGRLLKYEESFHVADKKVAVLEEKLKRSLSAEIISGGTLAVGAALLGYAPNVWSSQPSGWLCIFFGSILIVSGIFSKVLIK